MTLPTAAASLAEFLGQPDPSPWHRRWLIGGAIVIALLVIALVMVFGSSRQTTHYASQPVQRGDLAVTVAATGNLAPTKQVNVGSEESGIVVNVFVQNNDHVRKGQPLAQLDPTLFRASVNQAQAQLQSAEASVAQNRASLQQAEATLRRYEEVARLSGGKVPAATELDTARADRARAAANLQAAEAQVAQARAQLSTSSTNLAKATIYAPVDGVVLSRQVEPGQTVAAAFNVATLFTIAEDLTAMKLDVKVDEADIGEIAVGNTASFTVDAYPGQTFNATVTRIDLGANATPTVNSAGTTTTSTSTVIAYTASLAVRNPGLLLRPGMTATSSILSSLQHNQMLVPNSALRFVPDSKDAGSSGKLQLFPPRPGGNGQEKSATVGRGSHQIVYVMDESGQPRPVSVIIGSTNGTLTAIIGGDLKGGMRVITGRLAETGK